MFPWNYGFHWGVGSVIFMGAFYAVLSIVAGTVVLAVLRARRAMAERRQEEIRWHADFGDLPRQYRLCRHMLTGEVPDRECRNCFDCCHCETHETLTQARPPGMPGKLDDQEEEILGMAFPQDRLYHRGHTWVHPETDGTLTVGLDELGRRLVGTPDRLDLPEAGAHVHVNGTGFRVRRRNAEVRVLSPVDGEVVDTGGPDCGWYLKLKPVGGRFDLRHLLCSCEIKPWLLREMERLQLVLAAVGNAGPTLADGGVPVPDIVSGYPSADWDDVCNAMFLGG